MPTILFSRAQHGLFPSSDPGNVWPNFKNNTHFGSAISVVNKLHCPTMVDKALSVAPCLDKKLTPRDYYHLSICVVRYADI